MTNREFAEKLIRRIKTHKQVVSIPSPTGEGYALAHEHIIAIIDQELRFIEEVGQ